MPSKSMSLEHTLFSLVRSSLVLLIMYCYIQHRENEIECVLFDDCATDTCFDDMEDEGVSVIAVISLLVCHPSLKTCSKWEE